MTTKLSFTEVMIRSLATPQSYDRGVDYYRSKAVLSVIRRGDSLTAAVAGSDFEPYTVQIALSSHGIQQAVCSCPYDMGGYCKHIVAVLLTCLRSPDQVSERASLTELLADTDQATLRSLLTGLLEQNPGWLEWVELELAELQGRAAPQPTGSTPTPPPLDPKPFRRQAQEIMGSLAGMRYSEAYWHTGGLISSMQELINRITPYLEAGDGRNALVALEAMTEVYLERWLDYDDSDGELGGFFSDIGQYFADALLSADLSETERDRWANKLTKWQSQVDDYGIDEAFDVAIAAAVQGWNDPWLQAVLNGEDPTAIRRPASDPDEWDGMDEDEWDEDESDDEDYEPELRDWHKNEAWFAGDLAQIRLNILERQGRTAEYLRLAQAEGRSDLYLTMLVKLDQVQTAVETALQGQLSASSALILAKVLVEQGYPAEAFRVAEHGLEDEGQSQPTSPQPWYSRPVARIQLAEWLRETALQAGQSELAQRAARIAFRDSPSLESYQAIQRVAHEDWATLKPDILAELKTFTRSYSAIDIYLYENMIDEAVAAAKKQGSLGFDQLRQVVEAAYERYPEWVIDQCRKQAEPIMSGGQSQHYHHAADWLERAKRAYLASGQADEWRTYLEGLIKQHTRKYALRPRLEALR